MVLTLKLKLRGVLTLRVKDASRVLFEIVLLLLESLHIHF